MQKQRKKTNTVHVRLTSVHEASLRERRCWWREFLSSVDSVRVCDSSVKGCVRGVGVRGVREGSG